MRYNAKKFIASLLIFTMIFQVLPLTAFANERTIVPNLKQVQYAYAFLDVVEGNGDDDTYVYNIGDGHVILSNGDKDELHFGPSIWKEDLFFSREEDDLLIMILDAEGDELGRVTMKNWYTDDKNKLSKIVFFDNSEMMENEIAFLVANPQLVIWGTEQGDNINTGSRKGYTFITYSLHGSDNVYCGPGNDIVVAGPGDDYIKDWSDSGGGGNNIFVYNQGDGDDRVDYYYQTHVPGDGIGVLRFGAGIEPEKVEVRNSGENVVFALIDGSGSVTFQRANRGDIRYCLDEIRFAGGEVWKWSEIIGKKVVRGTDEKDTLYTSSQVGETVTVYGLEDDDTIQGSRGNDIFVGGPGADYIKDWSDSGGGGNNVFIWNRDDGHDRVDYYYQTHVPGDGIGELRFGTGISPEEIEVRNNGEHVV
ncbi:MAG: hypothetical protein LBJ36_11135, partial [Synergistaceae bacterium]|nr:hypothetical protein [Synergistaceae bacterium]